MPIWTLVNPRVIRIEIEGGPEPWTTPLREDLCGGGAATDTVWGATVVLEEGAGELEYFRSQPDGGACWMIVGLVGIASVDGCADCSFAMEMTLDGLEVQDEANSACMPGELAIEGLSFYLGQSTVVLGVEEGITYYNLMTLEEAAWVAVPRGYSTVLGNTGNDTWYFGTY